MLIWLAALPKAPRSAAGRVCAHEILGSTPYRAESNPEPNQSLLAGRNHHVNGWSYGATLTGEEGLGTVK